MLGNEMKAIRKYWRGEVQKLKYGECPYNDPTLDWRDPYYMRKPFGNTPEELREISQAMARSIEKREKGE
jgi:hypothetical protein